MKYLEFVFIAICEAIIIGLIVRETNYEVGILVMMIMIYSRLSVMGD